MFGRYCRPSRRRQLMDVATRNRSASSEAPPRARARASGERRAKGGAGRREVA